ncbi:hypothetical protein [Streptomyces sp. NPDC094468]|uniref:hypothetical protein n=1 Tax=Streptomyces sp. NPDC094468 TaxID=3366066 RepID=UPI00381FE081
MIRTLVADTPVTSCAAVPGTAAVIAPYDDSPYPRAFAGHGWLTTAVMPEARLRPLAYQAAPAPSGFRHTLVHRTVRHSVQVLRTMGVAAVVAGSPAGIELAERIAWHLQLPGADPASSPLRFDRGRQAELLSRSGMPALRGIRTTSLADAVAWASARRLPGYLLGPAVSGSPVRPIACTSDLQISAAWPAMRRAAAGYTGSQYLVLTERHSTQYTVHSATRPGPDGQPQHVITDTWVDSRTADGQVARTDLLAAGGLLARTLSLRTRQALDALGVTAGPATTRLAYGIDEGAGEGPLVVSVLAALDANPADGALRTATGRDRVADVLDAWVPSPGALVQTPGGQHIVRVRLPHGLVLDPATVHVVRNLPTVAAVSADHEGTEVVLSSRNRRAIEADYQAIRALNGHAPTA